MQIDIVSSTSRSRPSVLIVGEHTTPVLAVERTGRPRTNLKRLSGIDILTESQLDVARTKGNRWLRIFRLNRLVDIVNRWQAMFTEIGRRDVVQVDVDLDRSSVLSAFVILGVASYFGKRTVLALSSVRKDSLRGYRGILRYRLIKIANTVVASSEDAAQWARAINPNVKVIRRAASSQRLPSYRSDRVQPRVAVASPMDTRLLGSIVRGINFAKRKYPRAELVIMANHCQAGEIQSLLAAADRNDIELTTCEDDFQLAQLLATCDVYLETSQNIEPSLALIEALKQCMPIVVSDSCGTSNSFQHGVNGMIIPAGDHVALANRLCELVESPTLVSILSHGAEMLGELHNDAAISAEWRKLYTLLHRIGPIPTKRTARLQPQYQPSVKA